MSDNTALRLTHECLANLAGLEYTELPLEDQRRICLDFLDARREDGCGVPAYLKRIGIGNLSSYADCLRATPWAAL